MADDNRRNPLADIKNAAQTVAQGVKGAVEGVKDAAQGVATSVKDVAQRIVPEPVQKVTVAVGTGIAGAANPALRFIGAIGDHFIMLGQVCFWTFRRPFRSRLLIEAMEYIGIGSLPIITLVGCFTGMVTALQSVNAFRMLKAEGYAGSAVGLSLAVELGPVLTGLMLAGRAGAGIATELGTMRITEQIDALETMAVSPIQYLVVPRVIAGILMGPVLFMAFYMIGMVGAYFVAVVIMNVDSGQFMENYRWYVDPPDILQGLIKASVFGLALTLIGCYQGYNASGGGRGVGLATTRAVVIGSVTILVLDYFLSDILIALLHKV
jgi:phospholipid/cholesterol/gamma-HCH transport system permease protein